MGVGLKTFSHTKPPIFAPHMPITLHPQHHPSFSVFVLSTASVTFLSRRCFFLHPLPAPPLLPSPSAAAAASSFTLCRRRFFFLHLPPPPLLLPSPSSASPPLPQSLAQLQLSKSNRSMSKLNKSNELNGAIVDSDLDFNTKMCDGLKLGRR